MCLHGKRSISFHNNVPRLVAESFRSSPIRSVLAIVKVAHFNIERIHGSVIVVTRRTRNNVNVTKQCNETVQCIP